MKKTVSLILAVILMVIPMCIESYAEGETNYDDLVAPCYNYLSTIRAGISEASLGFVNCTSNAVCLDDGITMELTCALQRTDGTHAWEDYKTKTQTTTSSVTNTISKSWFAPANYAYRVKTTVVIKSSSGTTLETATKTSGVIYK